MKYLPLAAIIVTLVILLYKRYLHSQKTKRLEAIRRRWGQPNAAYYNFDSIGKYLAVNKEMSFHILNQQTKNDIDFNDLFTFADHTSSKPGQQYLYDKMSRPGNDIAALQQFNTQVDFFSKQTGTREKVQLLLQELNDENAYHIASILSGELPEKPAWFNWVIADIFFSVLVLLLSFYFPFLLAWLMVPLAVNLALHYWNKNNTFYFSVSLPQLTRLITVCNQLSKEGLPLDNEEAVKSIAALKKFQRIMRWLGYRQSMVGGDAEMIVYYLVDMVKAFFLVELIAFFSLIKELKKQQAAVTVLFKYAGAADTAIAVASLRAAGIATCLPAFVPAAKELLAEKIYHPLIEDCVTNDIQVSGKSMLITGSNMSGKTTFLRTIAVNAVLAQTLYTCFAQSYRAPIVKVFSSVRLDDNLLEGKSYYFEEVSIMAALVNEAQSAHQNVFILDEVFKGTNTIERIAAAKAILSFLNQTENIVFVSTHDIELAALLTDTYALYHFEETITGKELQFDHRIKPGPLKTRNAIKILEMAGYPMEIIREANVISKTLSSGGVTETEKNAIT